MSDFSRFLDLQELPKYFNDTAISTFFVLPSLGIFTSDLNYSESAKEVFGSSL